MINVSTYMLGAMFQANCWLGVNENNEAFAVDIGGDPDVMLERLEKNGISLKMILLTHGHFDHIRGVAKVAEKTGAKVYIHSEDAVMLSDPKASLADFVGGMEFEPVKDFTEVSDGDAIDFCGTEIKVLHTPGHTKGGVCFIMDDIIFSGDTLFCGSVGRTDFPGSSFSEMRRSLQKLVKLGEERDYRVYPGHEETTTLRTEIEYNPYIR